MDFAELLVEARTKKQLSKIEAARLFGWSPMYYGRYENNQLLPTKTNIQKFADFIGISVPDLLKIVQSTKQDYL